MKQIFFLKEANFAQRKDLRWYRNGHSLEMCNIQYFWMPIAKPNIVAAILIGPIAPVAYTEGNTKALAPIFLKNPDLMYS